MSERHIRITVDLPFPADDKGEVLADVRPVYLALLAAIEAAKVKAEAIVSPGGVVEVPVSTKRHLCRHAEGLACESEVEIGVVVAEPVVRVK